MSPREPARAAPLPESALVRVDAGGGGIRIRAALRICRLIRDTRTVELGNELSDTRMAVDYFRRRRVVRSRLLRFISITIVVTMTSPTNSARLTNAQKVQGAGACSNP